MFVCRYAAAIAASFLVVTLFAATTAAQPAKSKLRFIAPTDLRCSARGETVSVTVLNCGKNPTTVSFTCNPGDIRVQPNGSTKIQGYSAKKMSLTIISAGSKPATGHLLAVETSAKPTHMQIQPASLPLSVIGPPRIFGWWSFVWPLPAGLALVVVAWLWPLIGKIKVKHVKKLSGWLGGFFRERNYAYHALQRRMGPVNWDYSKSWGSFSGLIGGAIGALTAAKVLHDHPTVSTTSIEGLVLFFGALIAVAPLLYTATQRPKDLRGKNSTAKEVQMQGCVGTFLAASVLTLAGVIGEAWVLWMLLREIDTATVPRAMVTVMQVGLGVGIALLIWYVLGTIPAILAYQCDMDQLRERQKRRPRTALEFRELSNGQLEPRKPTWSVL